MPSPGAYAGVFIIAIIVFIIIMVLAFTTDLIVPRHEEKKPIHGIAPDDDDDGFKNGVPQPSKEGFISSSFSYYKK
jgi:hypothetical protein